MHEVFMAVPEEDKRESAGVGGQGLQIVMGSRLSFIRGESQGRRTE
jgi:hypothetical protein